LACHARGLSVSEHRSNVGKFDGGRRVVEEFRTLQCSGVQLLHARGALFKNGQSPFR
jgi:hypothetical protein